MGKKLSESIIAPICVCVQLENLCCPLLYIVGEDDLSCAAMENANEVVYV